MANVCQAAKQDLGLTVCLTAKVFLLVGFLEQDFRFNARKHAMASCPHESCGLVVDGRYFPCRNIALDPATNFAINPADYARAMFAGTIEAVVHSHPQGTPVSEHDRKACTQTKIPWYVYSVPDDQWLTIKPC